MTCAAERWCGVKGKFTIKPSNLSHLNPEIESSGSWHNWQGNKNNIYIYIHTHIYIYINTYIHIYKYIIISYPPQNSFVLLLSCFPCAKTDDLRFGGWPPHLFNSTKCLDQIHRHKELLYILRFWKPGRKRFQPKVRVSFGWVVCTVWKGWSSKNTKQ